jgi:hypothetical protein
MGLECRQAGQRCGAVHRRLLSDISHDSSSLVHIPEIINQLEASFCCKPIDDKDNKFSSSDGVSVNARTS